MTKYYKAVREDGRSFTGDIDYLTPAVVKHPKPVRGSENAVDYLSVSTEPGDCTGFTWPARLFEVKPVGRAWTPHKEDLPNKRAVVAVKDLVELPAHLLFGPQGEQLVAMIERFEKLSVTEKRKMYALRGPGWYETYWQVADDGRADRAGLVAARRALYLRLFDWYDDRAAYGAALAVLLRHTIGKKDGIAQADYDLLTAPWVAVTGERAHAEDVTY